MQVNFNLIYAIQGQRFILDEWFHQIRFLVCTVENEPEPKRKKLKNMAEDHLSLTRTIT